jgi:hypothetical protein
MMSLKAELLGRDDVTSDAKQRNQYPASTLVGLFGVCLPGHHHPNSYIVILSI